MTDPTDAANTGDSRPPAVSPPETDAPDVAIIARRVAAEAAPVAAASAEDVGTWGQKTPSLSCGGWRAPSSCPRN